MSIRVQVTTLIPVKLSFHWFAMEVADAASIEECYQQFVEHGIIRGERLKLDRETLEDDGRKIVGRVPIIVGRAIVATIFPLPFEVKEG